MDITSEYPFLRLNSLFIIGILLGSFSPFFLTSISLISVFGFLVLFSFLFCNKNLKSLFISLSILWLGYSIYVLNWRASEAIYEEREYSVLKVDSWVKKHKKGRSFIAVDSSGMQISAFVLDTCISLQYGDVLITSSRPNLIESPNNPTKFDSRKYWNRKGVLYSVFIERDIKIITNQPSNLFISKALRTRKRLGDFIDDRFVYDETRGIAKALLLGIKDEINNDNIDHFRKAGVTHIISISGLHVGIILGICLLFSRTVRNVQIRRFLVLPFIIILLWMYSFIAGLSTSIMRATIMCTVFLIGNIITRKPRGFNTLFFSSFIILFFDPNQLFSVGFQLSFLAVGGILAFHKPLMDLAYTKNKILKSVCSLVILTVSAQITTAPLIIYYFNSVSLISILSNLILVPFSSLMVASGFFFLFIGALEIEVLTYYSSLLFETTIQIFNYLSALFGGFSFSSVNKIDISTLGLMIYFVLVILIHPMLFGRSLKIRGRAFAGCCLIISMYFLYSVLHENTWEKSTRLSIYYEDDELMFDIKSNGLSQRLSLSELEDSDKVLSGNDGLFELFYIENLAILVVEKNDMDRLHKNFISKFDIIVDPVNYQVLDNSEKQKSYNLKSTFFKINKEL